MNVCSTQTYLSASPDIVRGTMAPQCTSCGQELAYIPQYQQWYCNYCRIYPFVQQNVPGQQYYSQMPGPQYVSAQPPVMAPTTQSASVKIISSFMSRQTSDKFIPTSWVWIIVLFQVVFPISSVIAIYAVLVDANITIQSFGILLVIILIVLLLSIALAISSAVLFYKLAERQDWHTQRDQLLMEGMIEYLGALSLKTRMDLNVERWTMTTLFVNNTSHTRDPSLWALFVALITIIPIVGLIFLIYSMVLISKDIHEHDEKQRALNLMFQQGLLKTGKISAISQTWQPLPKRDNAVYFIMTIFTLGLFLPYWWYVNIKDMNTHMANQWLFENILVKIVQAEG